MAIEISCLLCRRLSQKIASVNTLQTICYTIFSVMIFLNSASTTQAHDTSHLCPNGFIGYHHSCYKFMAIKASWIQAEQYCRVIQAHLVSIQTWRENYMIMEHIRKNKKKLEKSSFWIGGNDFANEGEWRWVANNHAMDFTSWYSYQPDNGGKHSGEKSENCMEMERKYGYSWNDQPCHLHNHFICEIELI